LFLKSFQKGKSFGVTAVIEDGVTFEVATFRTDGDYSDHRRPDMVNYTTSAHEDVLRRDFTINGMLMSHFKVVDYVGGQEDLKAKIIRAIGEPEDRFNEDALRMLRAVRFAAQLGFEIHINTFKAIEAKAATIVHVSRERVRDELVKLLTAPYAINGIALLFASGLAHHIFSEEIVDKWSLAYTLRRFTTPTFDGMKALAMFIVDNDPLSTAPQRFCNDFKLSTDQMREVVGAIKVRNSLYGWYKMTAGDQKLLCREHGAMAGVDLWEQDIALGKVSSHETTNKDAQKFIAELRSFTKEDLFPTPLLTGDDLIATGYEPSKFFKKVLADVEYFQLCGGMATKKEVAEMVKESWYTWKEEQS
jgi:tRNA nucleotidyltransferase/poly(A) polymerase